MAASCSGDKAASGGGGDAPGDAGAGGAEEETGHASEVPADAVGTVMLGAVVMGAVVPTGSGGSGGGSDMIATWSLITKLIGLGFLPVRLRRL